MSYETPHNDLLNWNVTNYDNDLVDQAIQKTNWDRICERASSIKGLPCRPLNKITNGLHNLVRLLEFSDSTQWIARISLYRSDTVSKTLRGEVDVMHLVKARSKLPVPRVFAYEIDENNPIGVPYILMEFIPGNTAMDAAGGYQVHQGRIPRDHRQVFYRSVAECHVQMSSLRFPKIGIVFKGTNGEYDIGPFPDIGGPFETAAAFFEAWAEHASFPLEKDEILQMMGKGPAQRVLNAINEFPSRIKEMSCLISRKNHGPFPLCHRDFFHSNTIVNKAFEVIGVIDWESASTLPLELVAFPSFLASMPAQFSLPERYDKDGLPLDEEEKQRWQDQQDYVHMVKAAEHDDHLLSTCLSDKRNLALAYSLAAFSQGKLGFYDSVLDEQERSD
ncbi:kinase-like domain-containing protein [Nemania abortiva]|nr:kinase-like domain-containing protein [Nemania abortiva]